MKKEIWKSCSVIGFNNYEVSNMGNVRNVVTNTLMNISVHRNGYKMVCLYSNREKRVFNVGRLILLCFRPIDNPDLYDADHIDGNKVNNCLSNLRWLNHSDNIKYANYKLHQKRNKRHTKGLIVVYPDLTKEYYSKWDECSIPNNTLFTMLKFNTFSKKYNCWVFYNGDVPNEYEYLFNNEQNKLF